MSVITCYSSGEKKVIKTMEHKDGRKKKILFIITKSNWGGAQRYVFDLATSLPGEKYEVAVAFGGKGVLKEKLEHVGIRTFEIKSFERDINIIKEARSMFELTSIIDVFEPDVLHLNSSKAGGSGAFVGRLMGVPQIIFTAHGWPFYENRNSVWRILAWFFSYLTTLLSHKVIVVSKHDYDKHMMPFCAYKLTHINTAIPHIEFETCDSARAFLFQDKINAQKAERNKKNIWVLTNAELNRNKNLFVAIDAVVEYNRTSEQKIFYAIMSDGELRTALENYIREKDAENSIVLLGYVDKGWKFFRAFDVFLLPSLKEGMPYVILEAGAAGLPVIASHVGGIPEIIIHEKNGLLIDPNNYKTIVSAFETLFETPELRQQLGDELKRKIEKEFALSEMLEKTERLYHW